MRNRVLGEKFEKKMLAGEKSTSGLTSGLASGLASGSRSGSRSTLESLQETWNQSDAGCEFKRVLATTLNSLLPSVLIQIILQYSQPTIALINQELHVIIGPHTFILVDDVLRWEGDALQKQVYCNLRYGWMKAPVNPERWICHHSKNVPLPNYHKAVYQYGAMRTLGVYDPSKSVFLVHRLREIYRQCAFLFPSTTSKKEFLLGLRVIRLYLKEREALF